MRSGPEYHWSTRRYPTSLNTWTKKCGMASPPETSSGETLQTPELFTTPRPVRRPTMPESSMKCTANLSGRTTLSAIIDSCLTTETNMMRCCANSRPFRDTSRLTLPSMESEIFLSTGDGNSNYKTTHETPKPSTKSPKISRNSGVNRPPNKRRNSEFWRLVIPQIDIRQLPALSERTAHNYGSFTHRR